jgi:uncharacterized protein with NRDE domain
MCLILFAYKHHPDYPLILAANRDEFYERSTSKAHFWEDHPGVLAGRDIKYGGTWMGITTGGRFAAVTNYRDLREFREHPMSRGLMVKEFLTTHETPETFLEKVIPEQDKYNGFNLILGDLTSFVYYSNRGSETRALEPGIYGLSNHLIDTPWPKVTRSRDAFIRVLTGSGGVDPEPLFKILSDRNIAADQELPDTGFGLEWERILSSPFIATASYGTRATTVLLVNNEGLVRFEERSFTDPDDQGISTINEFTLSTPLA